MKTFINIKTDKEVKEGAQRIAIEIGTPLNEIISDFLKEFAHIKGEQLGRGRQLKVNIKKILQEASKDYKKKKNISKTFTFSRDALKYLHS